MNPEQRGRPRFESWEFFPGPAHESYCLINSALGARMRINFRRSDACQWSKKFWNKLHLQSLKTFFLHFLWSEASFQNFSQVQNHLSLGVYLTLRLLTVWMWKRGNGCKRVDREEGEREEERVWNRHRQTNGSTRKKQTEQEWWIDGQREREKSY